MFKPSQNHEHDGSVCLGAPELPRGAERRTRSGNLARLGAEMTLSPIVNAVGMSCNLRCPYCFYEGHQSDGLSVMSENTLTSVLSRLIHASPRSIRFLWHGGEPLLAGIPFYESVVHLQKQLALPNQLIHNSIQTNGTLVTPSWARFFATHHFGVGVSLDGPEHIHNRQRFGPARVGSFDRVMRGIRNLQENGIITGVIAVVTSFSVGFPDEIFQFFYENCLSFSANECIAKPNDPQAAKELSVDPLSYARFLLRIFDLWLATANPEFRVAPLDDIVRAVLGRHPHSCLFSGSCSQHLKVDCNGDIYPCNEYPNPNYRFGNLLNSSMETIATGRRYEQYYRGRCLTLGECASCRWVRACQGWCRRAWGGQTALRERSEHRMCAALQLLFDKVSSKLEDLGYEIPE
jgi:uncharacterized protein